MSPLADAVLMCWSLALIWCMDHAGANYHLLTYTSWLQLVCFQLYLPNKITALVFVFGKEGCVAASPTGEDHYVWLKEAPATYFPLLCWWRGRGPRSVELNCFLSLYWRFLLLLLYESEGNTAFLQATFILTCFSILSFLPSSLFLHIRPLIFQQVVSISCQPRCCCKHDHDLQAKVTVQCFVLWHR